MFSTQRTELICKIAKWTAFEATEYLNQYFASFEQENLKDFLIKHIYLNLKKMSMLKIAYTGFVVRLLRGRND